MATFTVVAGGTEPITYQWEEDTAGNNIFVPMAGETNASLTVLDTSVNQYRVVVTNPCGTETSNVVKIAPPSVTLLYQPTQQYFGSGTQHLISMDANGDYISFNQWGYQNVRISEDGGDTWLLERYVPRSYNANYQIHWMGYDPTTTTWWATPYRQEIRATGISWYQGASPWTGVEHTDKHWWGSPDDAYNAGSATQDIFNTYAHGGHIENGVMWLLDMQSQSDETIWRWPQPPKTTVAAGDTLINNGPESGKFGNPGAQTGETADVITLSVATGSCWFHMKFGNNLLVTYGAEAAIPIYLVNLPTDFADGATNVGTNVGQIITTAGGTANAGGNGKIAAQSATEGRILRDTNAGGTPGEVRFAVVDGTTVTPPAAGTDAVYQFGKEVRTPCIGYNASEGWLVTAIDHADSTKILVMKDPGDTPIELDLPLAVDADSDDRQLEWCPARNAWLLAQVRNRAAGGLECVLLDIAGV